MSEIKIPPVYDSQTTSYAYFKVFFSTVESMHLAHLEWYEIIKAYVLKMGILF